MKKFLIGILSALMLVILGVSSIKAESPVATATYDFTTYDNGMNGKWAVDTIHATLSFYETEGGYRVERVDTGTFETIDAESPGGDGSTTVSAGVLGTITGGITVWVEGNLLDEFPTHVGPIDLTESQEDYFGKYYAPFFEDGEGEIVEWGDWGWTYSTCNNGTWVDNEETELAWKSSEVKPVDIMGDITGEYVPCATPTTDVCANIDGDQSGVPDGLHLDASGQNCVAFQFGGAPPPPAGAVLAGQVLGATTLGATGGVEENIFLALFALGSILVGTGVRKLGVPKE